MNLEQLLKQVEELDTFLTRDANQTCFLIEAAPILARLLQKAIEQRDQIAVLAAHGPAEFEAGKSNFNAELDRIAKGEE